MIPLSLQVALAVGLSALPGVIAWGPEGHEIVATIAQIHLFPSTVNALCSILPADANCHLAPVASWADSVRVSDPRFAWTGALHFINAQNDNPPDECVFGEKGGWMGDEGVNILTGIQNTTSWLRDGTGGKEGSEEALKFLVHFLGDVHQPLHMTGKNKGANGVRVTFDGVQTNLHAVWDVSFINKSIQTLPANYTVPLPVDRVEDALRGKTYDGYLRQIVWEGVLGRFKDEILVGTWLECPNPPQQPPEFSLSTRLASIVDYVLPSWARGGVLEQLIISAQNGLTVTKQPPTDDEDVCPYAWAKVTQQLNCRIAWPKGVGLQQTPGLDLPELDTPEFAGKIKEEWLVERMLATGGIRLAGVLNYLFADRDEVERLGRGTNVWLV